MGEERHGRKENERERKGNASGLGSAGRMKRRVQREKRIGNERKGKIFKKDKKDMKGKRKTG